VAAAPRLMTVGQYFKTPETVKPLSKAWEPIQSSVLPEFTLSLEEIFEE
jgi:hypothetical protein